MAEIMPTIVLSRSKKFQKCINLKNSPGQQLRGHPKTKFLLHFLSAIRRTPIRSTKKTSPDIAPVRPLTSDQGPIVVNNRNKGHPMPLPLKKKGLTPLYWPQVVHRTGEMSGEVFYGRSVHWSEWNRTAEGIVGRRRVDGRKFLLLFRTTPAQR